MAQPENRGEDFDDAAVARAYERRAPYPPALYDALAGLAARRRRLLDLGCGPGKLALGLADHFEDVWAVDPSPPMIAEGRRLAGERCGHVRWILSAAETLEADDGAFDLAVAGASIHWMEPQVVFPKLARWLAPGAGVAIVEGDGPAEAPWAEAYRALIRGWVERLGGTWNDPAVLARARAHEAWIAEPRRLDFSHVVERRVDDFIEAEHSRATWTRAKLGADRAKAFDADLRRLLTPHAAEGVIRFSVRTTLLYGRPRAEPA